MDVALKLWDGAVTPGVGLIGAHTLPEYLLSGLQELLPDLSAPAVFTNLGRFGTLLPLSTPIPPHPKAACP